MKFIFSLLISILSLTMGCAFDLDGRTPQNAGTTSNQSVQRKTADTVDATQYWNALVNTCGCDFKLDGSIQTRREFKACAGEFLRQLRQDSYYRAVSAEVRRGVISSTCGHGELAVTCCTHRNEQTRCGVRSSSSRCRTRAGRQARVGLTESCVDACADMCWSDGECDDGDATTLDRCERGGSCQHTLRWPNDLDESVRLDDGQIHEFFGIRVVDERGQPAPGVRLETTHRLVLTSDNNGVIAFYEPDLMGKMVYFKISSSRYGVEPNRLGFHGVRLRADEGGRAVVRVDTLVEAEPLSTSFGDAATQLLAWPVPEPQSLYHVRFLDADTGRGVSLMTLRGTDSSYVSDNLGNVAIMGPDTVFQETTFTVAGHGYRFDADSVALNVLPGARATILLTRENVAERLYRVTGQGQFYHSRLLGLPLPDHAHSQNGLVMGQDTAYATPYKGSIFWLWGDTHKPSGPLGVFHVAAARSPLSAESGTSIAEGVELDYFTDHTGFVKAMAPASTVPGDGVTWMGGLTSVHDEQGEEHLFGTYGKFKRLQRLGCGMAKFNDDTELFEHVVNLCDLPTTPHGHTLKVDHGGEPYVYYHNGMRVRANPESLSDPDAFALYTAKDVAGRILRREDGELDYAWRTRGHTMTAADVNADGVDAGEIFSGQARAQADGRPLWIHGNSTSGYSEHRQRYFRLLQRIGGEDSWLGDIWYAEADTPLGPWVYATPILSHDRYTFYNPQYHRHFDTRNGQDLHFEATYTTSFAGLPKITATPRNDYNQVMYRLSLDDDRTIVPVPVYSVFDGGARPTLTGRHWLHADEPNPTVPFMAYDRAHPDATPLWWSSASCDPQRRLVAGGEPETPPVFFALAPGAVEVSEAHVDLKEVIDEQGSARYTTDPDAVGRPIAQVWRNPLTVSLPTHQYLGALVPDAGDDQCHGLEPGAQTAPVELSAAAVATEEGLTYTWVTGSGEQIGSQARIVHEFSEGLHLVILIVSAPSGLSSADTLLVRVMDP